MMSLQGSVGKYVEKKKCDTREEIRGAGAG
jgi:hypothetical protein